MEMIVKLKKKKRGRGSRVTELCMHDDRFFSSGMKI